MHPTRLNFRLRHARSADAPTAGETGILALLLVSLLTALLLTPAANADVMLMDTGLKQQAIRLQRMDDQAIVYFDAQGSLQAKPLQQFTQLIIPPPPPEVSPEVSPEASTEASLETSPQARPQEKNLQLHRVPGDMAIVQKSSQAISQEEDAQDPPPVEPPAQTPQPMTGILQLIDGQRISGKLIHTSSDGQLFHWQHPLAGTLAIKLDTIQAFISLGSIPGSDPKTALPGDETSAVVDHLRLANGDAMQGYVAAITEDALVFEPQSVDQRIELPWAQVRGFTLANAPLPDAHQPVTTITLADDTTLRVSACTIDLQTVTCTPSLANETTRPVSFPLTTARRIVFANERVRLVRLWDLPWRVEAGGRVFVAPLPVRLSHHAMHLHAPLTLTLDLPEGALAVTATASLDIAKDDPALPWADVSVSLASDASASANAAAALSAERMKAVLHSRVSGNRLLLTLDPALNGPIMDRVKITDAWIAVERK